jgi:predicted ribosome quality control (RQC) complex YloA/Tae2 family protein
MSFDALTLAAVRDELEPLITSARMQKLIFVDELSLAVEFFAPAVGRTYVLLSAHLVHGRIQRIRQLPARGVERDSPFTLLVRKHLRNARVRSVHQPPLERVFELECEQRDPSDQLYRVMLIVEAMGRRSNLVLVDADGVILDAARRTPPSRNARRPILPHLPYSVPPPQERLLPAAITPETLSAGEPMPLAKRLGERVAGLSPLAAREIAFRATGVTDAATTSVNWSHVTPVVQDFVGMADRHDWWPCLALDDDGHPVEYAPYRLGHLEAEGAHLSQVDSISEAMTAFYAAERSPARRGDTLAAERKALLAPLERAVHASSRRIAALEHQLSSGQSERDPLRSAGELILAHQAEIEPGAIELNVEGECIRLDSRLSAVDNAQAYFARYRKARETEERVPQLLDEARQNAAHLDQLRTLVEVAEHMDAIRALRREVAAATGTSARSDSKRVSKSAPFRRVAMSDGWEALIGTSASGNASVTFDVARADDLWLHARGVPGAHVILRTERGTPPESVIEHAAQLAAAHSSARTDGAVEVDVTQRRYVKKIPGGPPGLVRYANERTLRVSPSLS